MMTLCALIKKSLSETTSKLTYYKRLLAELKTNENDETSYQGISLARFDVANDDVSNHYANTITQIGDSMENGFTICKPRQCSPISCQF